MRISEFRHWMTENGVPETAELVIGMKSVEHKATFVEGFREEDLSYDASSRLMGGRPVVLITVEID